MTSPVKQGTERRDKTAARAQAAVREYAAGAAKESDAQNRRHTPLTTKQSNVQVARAVTTAERLRRSGVLILNDPVGTGKTVVALAAARLLLDAVLGRAWSIDKVLVIAPSQEVAREWRKRAAWVGLTEGARGSRVRVRTVREMHLGVSLGLPADRSRLLVIFDEAHRGLHNENTIAYQALRKVAKGARVLLVTATPFQLTGSGLETMLEVDGQDTRGDNIRNFSQAVAAWLRREHADQKPDTLTSDLEQLRKKVTETLDIARDDLDHVLMPAYPHKAMGRQRWLPLPKRPLAVGLGEWEEAYHSARVIPELLWPQQNSDSYMRMLVSSTGAWHASAVCRSAIDQGGAMQTLIKAIDTATGHNPADHPKVQATIAAAADALGQGHHVLIFCVFIATKGDLYSALTAELRHLRSLNTVTVANDLTRARAALGSGFGREPDQHNPAMALIVSDKLSESVDLDGGRPVVIHHDLSWSPVRWEQRMGRVVRASTGFKLPPRVIVPILQVDIDQRLWATLEGRRSLIDHVVGERQKELVAESLIGLDVEDAD